MFGKFLRAVRVKSKQLQLLGYGVGDTVWNRKHGVYEINASSIPNGDAFVRYSRADGCRLHIMLWNISFIHEKTYWEYHRKVIQ